MKNISSHVVEYRSRYIPSSVSGHCARSSLMMGIIAIRRIDLLLASPTVAKLRSLSWAHRHRAAVSRHLMMLRLLVMLRRKRILRVGVLRRMAVVRF